ncbi:MAG: endonuclease/exonuclease/phosphatase family protein [Algicola sp.]|nr:endonuclease/exonuclease/phosphatase family protein [Algicola sp.]
MTDNKQKRRVSLVGLLQVAAFFTALFSILSVAQSWHYTFELLAHFKLQYLLACAIFSLLFLLLRQFKTAGVMSLMLLLNGLYVAPWYFTAGPVKQSDKQRLKLIQSNVNSANQDHQKVIELVKTEQPDIFVAQEVNRRWVNQLKAIETLLPYKIVQPRSDNFGIALYSKYPLDKAQVIYLGKANVPSIEVQLSLNQKPLTILATHPLPPIGAKYYALRNDQFDALVGAVKTTHGPLVLIGDLNVTVWSNSYQKLIDKSGLVNARQGFGLLPSWPSLLPFAMIPIDHCLMSGEFTVIDIQTGPDVGSDHLPLIVELDF